MCATIRKFLPWLCCGLLLGGITPGCAQEAPPPPGAVAVVAGQPISQEELDAAVQGQLSRMRNQEYAIKRKALEHLIEQRLLAAAARRQGVSVPELWKQVDAKVPDPTDAEVEAYYLGQRYLVSQPFEQVKAQMRAQLKAAEIEQARKRYLKALREKSGVEIYLQKPRLKVGYDPGRLLGSPQAPVRIVEFADFQCPYCRREQAVLKALLAKYGGRVSLAYRDFPLGEIHNRAAAAAEASRCAEAQGKFWEYHDLLFADPPRLGPADLLQDAAQAGLDQKAFSACLSSGKYKAAIDEDRSEGERLGVRGTPAFFINGVFLSGAQPMEEFEKIIDPLLAGSKHPQTAPASAAPPATH